MVTWSFGLAASRREDAITSRSKVAMASRSKEEEKPSSSENGTTSGVPRVDEIAKSVGMETIFEVDEDAGVRSAMNLAKNS